MTGGILDRSFVCYEFRVWAVSSMLYVYNMYMFWDWVSFDDLGQLEFYSGFYRKIFENVC